MAQQDRWEQLIDQLWGEIERMSNALEDAAKLAAEQGREIGRLREDVDRLSGEMAASRVGDDERRPRPIGQSLNVVEGEGLG